MIASLPSSYVLRAQYVLPVASPPIENGAVAVRDGWIAGVGRYDSVARSISGARVVDLGEAALLPGLVNAHTHLEFSGLSAPLGVAGNRFADWVEQVVAFRRSGGVDTSGWVAQGVKQSLACGVTSIGEIATPGWSVEPLTRRPAGGVVFQELLGLAPHRLEENLAFAREHVGRWSAGNAVEASGLSAATALQRWQPGLSPHAPYTVHPELLERTVELAAEGGLPVAMHLAESPEELELLARRRGPLVEFLERLEAWDEQAVGANRSVLDYLRVLARAPRALVVHGNYLTDAEIGFLTEHRDRVSVVYCPRTQAYFAHPPHPLPKLLEGGINVALGTDSLASNPDLSLLAELRFAARCFPAIAPATLLNAATIGGAIALGRQSHTGTLEPGKSADFAVIRIARPIAGAGANARHLGLLETLLLERSVAATLVHGQLAAGAIE